MGSALSLTGPETLTRADAAARLATALGRDIPYRTVTRAEAVEQLTPSMGDSAEWYLDILADGVDAPQEAASTVIDVVGSATTFMQWARAHADEFR
ncbi:MULTISPECIES: hypothetical protein [Actinoalloteichus]|uniref:hypothetical protein n=1 Tax=Actinoalloteichus TaxID=65496 RepID=UPI0009514FAA|nr:MULTISPECIES: hypothetical protein [Actinoalloteichus]